MYDLFRKKLIIGLSMLFISPAFCGAQKMFLFNSEVTPSFYQARSEEGDFGINGSASPSLFLTLSKNRTLFGYYDISYQETTQVIEEDGVRWTDRVLGQFLSLGYKKVYDNKNENKLTLSGYLEYSKGTADESLATGLYNYYDLSLRDEIRMYTSFWDRPAYLDTGIKLYYRGFPNYEGLYYLIYDTGPRWEKDYYGSKLWVGSDIFWNRKLMLNFKITYLFKLFRDDMVMIEPENELSCPYSNDRRLEHIFNIDIGANRNITNWLDSGLTLETEFRFGGQNYYDSDRLTFINGVYDYQQYSLTPVFYIKPWKEINCAFAYEIKYRLYTENLAFDEEGNYKDSKLYKLTHALNLNVSYPVYRKVSTNLSVSWNYSASNNEHERVYGYNYETFNIGTSVSYEF